jgi:hypothetical protein
LIASGDIQRAKRLAAPGRALDPTRAEAALLVQRNCSASGFIELFELSPRANKSTESTTLEGPLRVDSARVFACGDQIPVIGSS